MTTALTHSRQAPSIRTPSLEAVAACREAGDFVLESDVLWVRCADGRFLGKIRTLDFAARFFFFVPLNWSGVSGLRLASRNTVTAREFYQAYAVGSGQAARFFEAEEEANDAAKA